MYNNDEPKFRIKKKGIQVIFLFSYIDKEAHMLGR